MREAAVGLSSYDVDVKTLMWRELGAALLRSSEPQPPFTSSPPQKQSDRPASFIEPLTVSICLQMLCGVAGEDRVE